MTIYYLSAVLALAGLSFMGLFYQKTAAILLILLFVICRFFLAARSGKMLAAVPAGISTGAQRAILAAYLVLLSLGCVVPAYLFLRYPGAVKTFREQKINNLFVYRDNQVFFYVQKAVSGEIKPDELQKKAEAEALKVNEQKKLYIESRKESGNLTPLEQALLSYDPKTNNYRAIKASVRALVRAGADSSKMCLVDGTEYPIVGAAYDRKDAEFFEPLLRKENVNCTDAYGRKMILIAASTDFYWLVEYLIERGAAADSAVYAAMCRDTVSAKCMTSFFKGRDMLVQDRLSPCGYRLRKPPSAQAK